MERRRRRAADALLWAALALPVVTVDRIGLNEPRTTAEQLAGIATLAAAVAARRKSPLTAFAATAVLSLASEPALLTLSYGPALAAFALLLGLQAQTRPALTAFGAVGVIGTLQIAVRGVDPSAQWLVLIGTLHFGVVFPWLGGRYWRQSREQLEWEQRIAEDRARLSERARIAQDMHDSLGHELSLIALRAGALQLAPDLAEHHRTSAADLRQAASDATERLHLIIGLLREEDDGPAPLTPAGETVEELVARAAESGLPVRWEATGTAGTYSLVERIVHRVVRESLTNAARHAPGAAVTVAVRREAEGTEVSVVNEASTEAGSSSSGGTGLLGLRTAVEGVGGRFEAGPSGEGFRVMACVPAASVARVASGERAAEHLPPSPPDTTPSVHARRRVVLSFAGAVAVGAVFLGGAVVWYAYTKTHSVLKPGDYAELRLGTPLDEAERVLPDRTVSDPPVERAPAVPKGTDCRYYRASGQLFVSVEHFRLCFDDRGRLVAKDVVPKGGTAGQGPDEEKDG
ncbi:sensor histidine kinase [Streptomyces sp. NPDC048825]|uniref:sensor histidine kinase n=1 Tax=Streptomyces sp. NPDC048825 TaxID=3365592 RepID=UPI00370F93E6